MTMVLANMVEQNSDGTTFGCPDCPDDDPGCDMTITSNNADVQSTRESGTYRVGKADNAPVKVKYKCSACPEDDGSSNDEDDSENSESDSGENQEGGDGDSEQSDEDPNNNGDEPPVEDDGQMMLAIIHMVQPNPAIYNIVIDWELFDYSDNVQISIQHLMENFSEALFFEELPGMHSTEIELYDYPPGEYILQILVNDVPQDSRMIMKF